MMSLTERLAGKGTRQDMEYEQESVHNVPAIAPNTIFSMAKKFEDNLRTYPAYDDCTGHYAAAHHAIKSYGQPTMCLA